MAVKNLLIIICFIVMPVHLSAGEIEITALAGQNTTLPCTFEGIPLHVAWLKGDTLPGNAIAKYVGNKIIYPGNTEKYSVQKDFSSGKSSFPLTIADVELADAGRYRCAVTDLNGTLSTELRKKTYNIKLLDALNTSVTIPALHGSTPTTPASTQTVTTTNTDSRNQTVDDTSSGISLAAKLWITFGVILGVFISAVAFVIIKVYRNRDSKAIQQRLPQRTSIGRTMYQLSTTTNKDDNEDDNENEEVNETVC